MRLLKLEIYKNITYPGFWIIIGLHYFFLVMVLFNLQDLAGSFDYNDNQYGNIDFSIIPILHFPDIWHNITYIAGFFKILLGIYMVIAITNEFQYNTIRTNMINGLTRTDFVFSKQILILGISLISLAVVFVTGLMIGNKASLMDNPFQMLDKSIYLLGYLLELLLYLNFALLTGILLKRTGISIFMVMIYPLLIEPLIRWRFPDHIDRFFPIKAMDQLIVFPFAKYVGIPIEDGIALSTLLIAAGWIFMLYLLSNIILRKKSL